MEKERQTLGVVGQIPWGWPMIGLVMFAKKNTR